MFNEFLKEFKEFGKELWNFLFPSKLDPFKDISKISMSRFQEVHEQYGKAPVLYAVFGKLRKKDEKEKIMDLDLISMMVVPAKPGSPQAKEFLRALSAHLEKDTENLKKEIHG